MNKYNVLNSFVMVVLVFIFARNVIGSAKADDLFGGESLFSESTTKSDTNTIWKSDGSLVNIKGAEDSGYVIKDGEIEYFVEQKNDGSPTFIYDDELIVCTNTGCY